MIKYNDKASAYLTLVSKYQACIEAVDYINDNPNMTVLELMENNQNKSWAHWNIRAEGVFTTLDNTLRNYLISLIKDESQALLLYTKCEYLTDDEANALLSRFHGKLPTAEKEVKDSIVPTIRDIPEVK